MDSDKLSKKELKQMKKLHELERGNLEKRQSTMKWIVIGVISFLFLSLFTALIIFSKQQSSTVPAVAISEEGWIRGNKDAAVTMVEFSDFQCPACQAYEPLVQSILKDYEGKVKLLYKHFPIKSVHPNAIPAAKAAEAAGKQGKFWEYHDVLFEKQKEWEFLPDPTDKFTEYATALKLDIETFKKDLEDKAIDAKVSKMENEGINLGVNSTPTFFINGKKVETPAQYLDFKKLIDEELKVIETKGK